MHIRRLCRDIGKKVGEKAGSVGSSLSVSNNNNNYCGDHHENGTAIDIALRKDDIVNMTHFFVKKSNNGSINKPVRLFIHTRPTLTCYHLYLASLKRKQIECVTRSSIFFFLKP